MSRRVLVTGASGNVGTALLRRLRSTGDEVIGLSRRHPGTADPYATVRWVTLDLGAADAQERLLPHLDGVDAVVHLAWLIQPSHDRHQLHRVNQGGTHAVVNAVRRAGVAHLVHMSSVGTYAPVRVPGEYEWADESWPTWGLGTSTYSVDKAAAERIVDALRDTAVTRVRPALILQPDAASEVSRYFLGRLVPLQLLHPALLRFTPFPRELRMQFVHTADVADALVRILDRRLTGGLNLAAPAVIDREEFRRVAGGVAPPLPLAVARALATATWRAHLQPTDAGWLDLGSQLPLLLTDRARDELGWAPTQDAGELLRTFVAALHRRAGGPGPLLTRRRPA